MSDRPKKISDVILFYYVAKLLEKTESSSSGNEKTKRVKDFLGSCRDHFKSIHGTLDSDKAQGDSMYSIIRILLPSEDRGRTAYGFQATTLGRMLANILAVSDKDKKSLTHFKDPGKTSTAGDFGSIVFAVLQSRFSDDSSTLEPINLTYLHSMLDNLARSTGVNQTNQKKILMEMFTKKKVTPLEGKWLCRILLKKLYFGVNSTQLFGMIHPKAKELFERIGNLEKVCQQLNDPEEDTVDVKEVKLFYYCRPMLCTRMLDVNDGFEIDPSEEDPTFSGKQGSKKKKVVLLPAPPYYVETKYDGERFQIHYDGFVFKYFSRRGHDFSDSFNKTLTPQLRLQLKPGVESFILDGEMMAWHKKYKWFTQKGEQIDVKKMTTENRNHCPVFVAFDVLYFNEEVQINTPLDERIKIVTDIIEPKEGVVLITEHKIMNTSEQVINALNEAIDNLDEGLIVKHMKSRYEPGKRLLTWLKIKPEFLDDNKVDDLDLLILGAYFGDSVRKGGTITHFLVGVINKKFGQAEEFYPVAQVGSGRLRNPEMKALVDELQPRLTKTEFKNVIYKARKRPDLFIDPKASIVLQIKASEINASDMYVINYSLRFPRITTIRRDKPYDEVMSLEEFHRIRESCGGKLVKRTDRKGFSFRKRNIPSDIDDSESDEETKSNAKRKDVLGAIDNPNEEKMDCKPGPSSRITRSSGSYMMPTLGNYNTNSSSSVTKQITVKSAVNIFQAKVFCVYGTAAWKSKIELDIKAHGGKIIQNPVSSEKFWIVGEKPTHIKVSKAISLGSYDVLKSSWILRCIAEKKEVEFTPNDFYHYSEETGTLFTEKYDEYGDSYTNKVSLEEMKSLISKIIETGENEIDGENSTDIEIEELKQDFGQEHKIKSYNFLKDVKVVFRDAVEPVLAAKVQFYGGEVLENEFTNGVTHVIVKYPLSPNQQPPHSSALMVKPKWLEECFEKQALIDERAYSV